nr:ATP-binding protein [Fundidesulfovibrio agrisoli]
MEEVIRPIVASFCDAAAGKGIRYEARVAPGVPARLVGDPSRLRQILFNLVGNAIKFTTAGHVLLDVYTLPHCPRQDHVNLHFSVTDTGIGIPEDKVGHIFGMFTQVEGSYSRRFGGTGLGLAIVRQLVELMGGTLSIATELGHGTEMHVTLPLYANPEPRRAAKPAARACCPADKPGNRVLVVEDESMNRLTAVRFLQHLGFEPVGVSDGHQALDILTQSRFDVVLMDIQMPEMDGLEATRRLRNGGTINRDVPVVALTAHAMSGDRDRFLAAGMDEYLTKPMEMQALREVLSRLLPGTAGNLVPAGSRG